MASLEDLILPVPAHVNLRIADNVSSAISFKQLGRLRIVNKTWKSAVETGLFGTLGRFHKPGAHKIVMLLQKMSYNTELTFTVALGILDQFTKPLYIHPISPGSTVFEEFISYSSFPIATLAHKTLYVGLRGPLSADPVDWSWSLCSLDLDKGEWTRRASTRESLHSQGFFSYRLCAWKDQLFLFGNDYLHEGTCQERLMRSLVLKYNASSKSWKPLPPLPEDASTTRDEYLFPLIFTLKEELFLINS